MVDGLYTYKIPYNKEVNWDILDQGKTCSGYSGKDSIKYLFKAYYRAEPDDWHERNTEPYLLKYGNQFCVAPMNLVRWEDD